MGVVIIGYFEFDDVQVEEGDMLFGYQGKLVMNIIVVGDGVIVNFVIIYGLVVYLVVDDSNIVNFVVFKLFVGSLVVGQYICSISYVFGLLGWLINVDGIVEFVVVLICG